MRDKLYQHPNAKIDQEFRNLYKNVREVVSDEVAIIQGRVGEVGDKGPRGDAGAAGLSSNTQVIEKVVTSPSIYWATDVPDSEIASFWYDTGNTTLVTPPGSGPNITVPIWDWRDAGDGSSVWEGTGFEDVGSEDPQDILDEYVVRKYIIPARSNASTQRGYRPVPIAYFADPVIIHRVYFHQHSTWNSDNDGRGYFGGDDAWFPEADGDFKVYLTDRGRPWTYTVPNETEDEITGPAWWAGDLQTSMFASFTGGGSQEFVLGDYPPGVCLNRHGIRQGYNREPLDETRYYWGDNQVWRSDFDAVDTRSPSVNKWTDPNYQDLKGLTVDVEPQWALDSRGPVITTGESSLWLDGSWGFVPYLLTNWWAGEEWERLSLLDRGFLPYALFDLRITIFYEEL